MGQRHQVFVKIINPISGFSFANEAEKKQAQKEFGTGKFSILAYHNQWLYGRSALVNCVNLLKFGKQFTKEAKSEDKGWGDYSSPVTVKGIEANFNTPEKLTTAIGFIMNFRPVKTSFNDAGIGNSWYVGKTDEGINHDFTLGDNNDGITIIDVVENKYCFMNINKRNFNDGLGFAARDLPYLTPVDARAYVSAYYGETIETTNPFYFGNHDRSLVTMSEDKQLDIVNKTIKTNDRVVKMFKGFEVLSLTEIKAMFPKMKELKRNLVVSN